MKYKVLRKHENLINQVMEFFTSKATNPEYFEKIKAFCLKQPHLKLIHNHDTFLGLGYLIKDDFVTYVTSNKMSDGVTIQVLDLILEALTEHLIILKIEPNTTNNQRSLYGVNDGVAKFYYTNGLLFNKFFGFNYIIEKYIPSVFKIENIKDGEIEIGNGFLVGIGNSSIIITNKHVVEDSDSINVKNHKEETIEYSKIIKDNKNDLALIIPSVNVEDAIPFSLNQGFQVLEEILTIGYPPIPTTKKSYPLFHVGEINSFVENYWGDSLFIFSAKTNPGNSGSPIIDRNGTIVGIVTQQLEEKEWYLKSKIPYYAGISSNEILRFLNEYNQNVE